VEAFQHRRPCFLALSDWIDTPFIVDPPSIMQSLLSQAARIPALLQRNDILLDDNCDASAFEYMEMLQSFLDILDGFEAWESWLREEFDAPTYWQHTSGPSTKTNPGHCDLALWFPNVTMSNVYTHLWAFSIVCLTEIQRLRSNFPAMLVESWPSQFDSNHLESRKAELTTLICRSMSYLMQDEMRLFGPASTLFPLHIAYHITRANPAQREESACVEEAIKRLVQKGMRSARIIICG
jgi:hypothetical protein